MLDSVRLDVWLDVACLFKTRSEAQRACKVGRVTVNGVVAKPHRDLHVGDTLALQRPGGRRQLIIVRALADRHIAKAAARELYEDRTPPPTAEEVEMRKLERLHAATTRAAPRLNRRNQHDFAKRKWTT
jgi:ribosome-associated heat shock protein Hsp15